jgi:poly-gamma-glutamate capsule biosynthesis protein CapA/YwtB (metallophosphatase superfamily)
VARDLTLVLCGDVMLGRGIDQILRAPCAPQLHESYVKDAREYIALAEARSGPIPRRVDPAYPWGDALGVLDLAGLHARVINLETSITRSDDFDREKRIHYRVSPENATSLAVARIDICVLGNNHVLDWGGHGRVETLATLDRLGIGRCGAGRDLDEAMRPAILDLGEYGRIAVFSIGSTDAGVPPSWAADIGRPGVHLITRLDVHEVRELRRVIDAWRDPGTRIVLSIHWGPNWGFETPHEHRRFAQGMIDDAGVHVVHGHSSHHVKGIEVHHGQPILYGCGDLLADYEGIAGHEAYRGDLSLLYLVTLDGAGALSRLEMVPMRTCRFRLERAGTDDTRWLATALARCGAKLDTSVAIEDGRLLLEW